MRLPNRDSYREWEAQSAFEDAERQRAERRAGALLDSLVDSSPTGIELFDAKGQLLQSNKAAERLLGKVPPPGIPLFDERGLKRAGLLEPQLKRVLAGTRVETPPTWYDPTDIGLAGVPGKKVCFRATVFPLFDAEGAVARIAVAYEDLTQFQKLEANLKEARKPAVAVESRPISDDVREVEHRRRKTEQALRDAEERHRGLFAACQDEVLLQYTEDGRLTGASPGIEALLGISAEAAQTDPAALQALVVPDDAERARKAEAEFRKSGKYPERHRFRVKNPKTGAVLWVEAQGSATKAGAGRALNVSLRDVTYLVSVEQALAGCRADLEALVTSKTEAVMVLDRDGKVKSVSPMVHAETGIGTDAVGKQLAELLPEVAAALAKSEHRQPARHEVQLPRLGTHAPAWLIVSSYPHDGGLLLLLHNSTAQVLAARELRQRQADAMAMLESSADGVIVLDPGLVVTRWSESAVRETRIAANEALGKALTDVYPELTKTGLYPALLETVKKRTASRQEIHYDDGRERVAGWFSVTVYPYDGGALLLVRNVSRSRKTEQAWLTADARLRALLETPGLAVAIKDKELRYQQANAGAVRMLGLRAESELLGRADAEVLKPSVAGLLSSADKQVLETGKPQEVETALPDAVSSNAGWYRVTKSPLRNSVGEVTGVLDVGQDITRRVSAQQELARRKEFLEGLLRDQSAVADKVQKELGRWQGK